MDLSERTLLNSEGGRIPILKSVNTVIIGDEEYYIESFIDLTDRKNVQKELKKQNETLQRFKDATVDQVLKLKEIEKENKALKQEIKIVKRFQNEY